MNNKFFPLLLPIRCLIFLLIFIIVSSIAGKELDEMNYKWERILPENKDWNEDLICEKEQIENFSMTM